MVKLDAYPYPHPQVAGRVIDGQALLILSEANLINVLNPVGSRVWELADGTHSVGDIVDRIVSEYEVERARVEAEVMAFVEQLVAEHVFDLSDVKIPSLES
jgi:hypothetical protein